MNARSILKSVLPIGAGILAGVSSSVLMRNLDDAAQPDAGAAAEMTVSARTDPSMRSARSDTGSERLRERLRLTQLAAMERRLEQVETVVSERDEPESSAATSALDPQEENLRLAERRAASIEAHRSEPIDVAWSRAASTTLTQDLRALTAKAGFGVVGVECRSSSCLATVEWPSYQAASDAFGHLLTGNLNVNCERQVLIPEPEEGAASAPYRTTVVLERCVRAPAGSP